MLWQWFSKLIYGNVFEDLILNHHLFRNIHLFKIDVLDLFIPKSNEYSTSNLHNNGLPNRTAFKLELLDKLQQCWVNCANAHLESEKVVI